MILKVNINKIKYQVRHLGNGQMVKEGGTKIDFYTREKESYGQDVRDIRRDFIAETARDINSKNRRAEERCQSGKNSTMVLLIITNIS